MKSYVNTIQNAEVNGVHNVEVLHGGLDIIEDQKFDVILPTSTAMYLQLLLKDWLH